MLSEVPYPATHNCTDFLDFLPELGDVTCTCRTSFIGLPAGRLKWISGNSAVVTGDYGVSELALPSGARRRQSNGLPLYCYLDWPESFKIFATSLVAYGPDSIDLHFWKVVHPNGTTSVVISCEVNEVNPRTADMFTWGGLCQGQQGFRCTLPALPLPPEDDGKEVTCTVTNAANNGHRAAASLRLPANEAWNQPQNRASDNATPAEGIGIGVGISLVLAALMIVLAGFVLWRRGKLQVCRCCDPIYDRPSRARRSKEEETRTYSDLDIHVISSSASTTTESTSAATSPQQENDRVYQNMGEENFSFG